MLQRELKLNLATGDWRVETLAEDSGILGPVDYGWARHQQNPACFTFGEGLLAGSAIPGSRRLVFCAYSSQWDGFYISSMGGAAYSFHGLGINYVVLSERCRQPSVLLLHYGENKLQVRLEPIDCSRLWQGYPDPNDDQQLIGFYALQQAIFDRYTEDYDRKKLRIFSVGPAAAVTQEGGIASSTLHKGRFTGVVDWCGRGGLGSRLLQTHNIAACLFSGDCKDPQALDTRKMNHYFQLHFGQSASKTDLSLTEKYRYHPKLKTGGTFGMNNLQMADKMLTYNYSSIYASSTQRYQLHKLFILEHYLTQFNEETIVPKKFQHCGEPCAVACKKLHGKYKKDYEPYHALGPQLGIFDQRAAEILNDHADAMGFDSIQLGGTIAWIMEIIDAGIIAPEDFGMPPASEFRFGFTADPMVHDMVADSLRNAHYAIAIIDAILQDPRAEVFRRGIRAAASDLDARSDLRPSDRAVFLRHGEQGHMVPNQYWVPGMFSPMPIMGKYYVYYGDEFLAPEQLGKRNVERMVYELFSDNTGICRFHRKWSESITETILQDHYGLDLDYKTHLYALASAINRRESAKSRPWTTGRNADLLLKFLEYWEKAGLEDPQLQYWLEFSRADKAAAAMAFWQAIFTAQQQAFAAGPEQIPRCLTPKQEQEQQVLQQRAS